MASKKLSLLLAALLLSTSLITDSIAILPQKSRARKRAAASVKTPVTPTAKESATNEPVATTSEKIVWRSWTDDLFEQAQRENKFVILDLEAVWCHWCHVMEEKTYSNPAVINLINSKYIAVRVDQDARPDLSNRYEDYGWPATIFFNSDGSEIVKRSGYIAPDDMTSLLTEIIRDPSPGPSVTGTKDVDKFADTHTLSAPLRRQAQSLHVKSYDFKYGGWGFVHKFLDWDSVEYSIMQARSGDRVAERMAKQTLNAQMALLDPAWGGVYQYSTGGRWNEPHFEKIMSMQAENLRIYALAYSLWPDAKYLHMAQEIHRYLKTFLTSPEGAFYTSQDADLVKGEHSQEYFALSDLERRKLGVPQVDTHIYARENGWVIQALTALYGATNDVQYLTDAQRAAQWIITHRSLPNGGFRHDDQDQGGPYLGDSLAMGRAFLSLYAVTGDRQWLQRSEEAVKFINQNFRYTNNTFPGLATASISTKPLPRPQRDENIAVARFANLLNYYTGKPEYRELAEIAMRYLATPDIAKRRPTAGVLLADLEMNSEPAHITVVGAKTDAQAQELFKAAINYPSGYKRVEWFDRSEGNLPNPDIEYPELKSAAAFACANQRCSTPAYSPQEVRLRVEKLNNKKAETATVKKVAGRLRP